MTRQRLMCAALLAFVLVPAVPACKNAGQGTATTTTSGSTGVAPSALEPRVPAVPETPVDAARKLALAKTPGSSAVDKLITDLQTAAQKNPNKVDYWVLLGRAWVRKARESSDPGFYVNANGCVEVALDVSPEDKLALDVRALVLLNDHKFQEARELAEKIVAKHPEDPMAWGNLSDALLEIGDFTKSADAAQKMMDLKPNLPSYSRASYFRWLVGDSKAALEYARLAIDSGRDTKDTEPQAWTMVQAATIFLHRGDYGGADAGFEKALNLLSEFPPALVGRGRVSMAKGDFKRAAELFSRAYTQSPLVETAWLMGDAREAAGDAKGAQEAFEQAEKEGRRSDPRTLSLMWSTKNKNAAESLALIETEKKVRGDIYTDEALAWALYRNGKLEPAKAAIDRARSHGTKDARLLYHQGAIHIATGDTTNGKKLVAEALALNPKFDIVGEAEAKKLLESAPAQAKK